MLIFLLDRPLYANTPHWFASQNLSHTQTQIVGYGQAKALNEAKEIAKTRIAQMLQLNIDSTMVIEKNASLSNYGRRINQTIKTTSHLRLNGLILLKKEQVDGNWFVAILYDNLPLFQKIIKSIYPQKIKHSNQPYLTKTKLFKQLQNRFGFYPQATIYSQNGQYYILIGNQQFLISQQEFVEFFINNFSNNINIELKERVKENEPYFITTKFKDIGFGSLFLVSHSGTVVSLFKNIELIDRGFTYPNKEEYEGLRANIEDGSMQSKDMFVAILCQHKEGLGLFNQISTDFEKEAFRFGDLIDLMERCTFATKILTIIK